MNILEIMMTFFIEPLLLGFSTGTYCTMYCAPVLVPFLFGVQDLNQKRNLSLTFLFLAGRFLMYMILGAVFAMAGILLEDFFNPVLARRLSQIAYILCGSVLLVNSLGVKFPWGNEAHGGCKCRKLHRLGNDKLTAIFAGLSVGLHICPPLWTAIARSMFGGHGLSGFFYFIFFYLGTMPFFLPILGFPILVKLAPVLRRIARISQLLLAVFFIIFAGLIPLLFQ